MILVLGPLILPPIVSQAGRMSSASSHFESHSVEVLACRSRALGRPSRGFRSTIIPSSSGSAAPDDSRATEALATMRLCFNVDSTVMARRLVDVREHYYVPQSMNFMFLYRINVLMMHFRVASVCRSMLSKRD
ncbi:hypothetical protein B296_00044545 [Ensete ventricosum]|uniref:Uncharacterized protein n=1 Tax=Ensete ventricosum TaxID=4639 RepID=A0A426XS43_ENSVE|nr:hypothetical protein B296_00044545 [Ensete ventricosum]